METTDVKTTVISTVIAMNVIANSLVIAVIARYPQLRQDRTTLFMLSLSLADLAAGCTFMPISAALCSKATTDTVGSLTYLSNVHCFFTWWFGMASMYSLCWLTGSKAIFILNPVHSEQLLPRRRCYVVIALIWTLTGLYSATSFTINIDWNRKLCSHLLPDDRGMAAFYMLSFVIATVLPITAIVYSTVRICIVVVQTNRQISALEQPLAVGTGNAGFVTIQAMRSSKNVIIICAMSLALNVPFLVFFILVNSLLYLFLYRSVKRKTAQMIMTAWTNIRTR